MQSLYESKPITAFYMTQKMFAYLKFKAKVVADQKKYGRSTDVPAIVDRGMYSELRFWNSLPKSDYQNFNCYKKSEFPVVDDIGLEGSIAIITNITKIYNVNAMAVDGNYLIVGYHSGHLLSFNNWESTLNFEYAIREDQNPISHLVMEKLRTLFLRRLRKIPLPIEIRQFDSYLIN